MKMQIAGEMFKSKADLLGRIRGILYRYAPGSPVAFDDAAFLTACLEQANQYYGYPAEQPVEWRVQTQAQELGGRYPEFVFCRADGTRENPSIKRLSMQKPLGGKSVKNAARQSIADQIKAFRRTKFGCESCGNADNPTDVHHDDVPFNLIWERFVAHAGVDESTIGIVEQRDAAGVMLSFQLAQPFHDFFAEFHARHAKLKLLCVFCHRAVRS